MSTNAQRDIETRPWSGPTRHYDIVKEGVIALIVVTMLVLLLAARFGSPDVPALTFKGWATADPADFVTTAAGELAGTTESAGYGWPYNKGGDGQNLGPLRPAKTIGVTIPVDPANDFVITPLRTQNQPAQVERALEKWSKASTGQQSSWAKAYTDAIADPKGANGDPSKVSGRGFGPVPELSNALLAMAQSGALDGILDAPGRFYSTDNTKQILFMGDGGYLDAAGTKYHLQGNQWGMINETGNYPGQQWLIPVSFWYQLPIFNSNAESGLAATLTANGDIVILSIVGLLALLFLLLPFIPGLRSIPRLIPIHRLIWRSYYRKGKR